MKATFYHGSALDVLPTMPAGSVHVSVTSPPYYALRAYTGDAGMIGLEKSPAEYVANLVRVFGELRRVLRDDGTLWLNCGDSYAASGRGGGGGSLQNDSIGEEISEANQRRSPPAGWKMLDMLGIPWLLAFALREVGWYLRAEVIWGKAAPMPSSVNGWRWERCQVRDNSFKAKKYSGKGPDEGDQSPAARMKTNTATMRAAGGGHQNGAGGVSALGWIDCPGCRNCKDTDGFILRKAAWRPTVAHEKIFLLSKTDKYFVDAEAVREPAESATIARNRYSRIAADGKSGDGEAFAVKHEFTEPTRNPRTIWRIVGEPSSVALCLQCRSYFPDGPPKRPEDGQARTFCRKCDGPGKPYRKPTERFVAHYAAFPTELVFRCLKASASERGYCAECGGPVVRVVESVSVPHPHPRRAAARPEIDTKGGNQADGSASLAPDTKTIGWRPSCRCQSAAAPTSATILDPFSGTGTTVLQALRMGHEGVGIDVSKDYIALATARIRDEFALAVVKNEEQ